MILTGPEIVREWRRGRIVIDPFQPDFVNPNSYNFRLGRRYRVYTRFPLRPDRPNPYEECEIPADDGLVLEPGRLYLCCTREILGSDHYAPTFAARSSIARLGLFINLSACLGDIGFIGQWTLQLHAIHPVRVYANMRIGQMMWWKPQGDIRLYEGKYQASSGPQTTLLHLDFAASRIIPPADPHELPGSSRGESDTGPEAERMDRSGPDQLAAEPRVPSV